MRLWHYKLLDKLPRQQLLGQNRECCALRGNGWGKKHATVDYVFRYSPHKLYVYHTLVMAEMARRGYKVEGKWFMWEYRGKNCKPHELWTIDLDPESYPEHDDNYLAECLENLRRKGIDLEVESERLNS